MPLALNNNRGSVYSGRMKIEVPKRKCLTEKLSRDYLQHSQHGKIKEAFLKICDRDNAFSGRKRPEKTAEIQARSGSTSYARCMRK